MQKHKGIALVLGVGIVGAVVVYWFSRRSGVLAAPGIGAVSTVPQTETPKGSSTVVAAVKTAQVVEDLLRIGAPAAVGAAVPVVAASVPAAGVGVGGSAIAGSVASQAEASAAIGATTPAGAATSGGSSGLAGFFTNPITIGVGAAILIGVWVWRARRNETKGDREDFAESLGFRSDATGTQLDHLFQKLIAADPMIGGELRNRALNVIGKHDTSANTQWMRDCMTLLGISPTQAPPLPYDAPLDDEDSEQRFGDDDLMLEL